MIIPDYGAGVEKVGTWIAESVTLPDNKKLEPGKTLFLENELLDKPDVMATVFETGGEWKTVNAQMIFSLLFIVRAPRLAIARNMAISGLIGVIGKWKTAAPDQRAGITNLRVGRLPYLMPRDEPGRRVILESILEMSVYAPFDPGVDL